MTANNLPNRSTPFVGRSFEIADIIERLRNPDCKLLTLMGPGGIGKTRLAIEVGSHISADFYDGVFFVPLQALSAPEHIALAIAQAIYYQLYGSDDPADQVIGYLADKQLLLILDNFDHLLSGAATVTKLLSSAPGAVILTTSRERLNLTEEWVYEVRGLAYDETNNQHLDAVQLFVQTAQRVRPGFPSRDEYQHVITICRLVEGMPLALELAASWIQRLPLQVIIDEIKSGLGILESRTLNAAERHRSMRAAFDYSWRMLNKDERKTITRLSVFRGGFQLEAAQEVCGATLLILASLVDKSLLRMDASGRYNLHELIRQYAEEALFGSVEERDQAYDGHCRYYLTFLAKRHNVIWDKHSKQALIETEQEIDNIRVAWSSALTRSGVHYPLIDAALDGTYRFYDILSWDQEAEQLLNRTADALDDEGIGQEKPLLFGRVLARLSTFVWNVGDFDRAKQLVDTSLDICRRQQAPEEIAFCLLRLAEFNYMGGTIAEGQAYLEESYSIFAAIGDDHGRAHALGYLGYFAHSHRDQKRAVQLLEQSVALFEQLGDTFYSTLIYYQFSVVLNAVGDDARAQKYADKSLRLSELYGFKLVMATSLGLLAVILSRRNRTTEGLAYARQALRLSIELRRMHLIATTLIACAHILVQHEKYEQALEWFSLTHRHPATLGDSLISIERGLAIVAENLSPEQYEMVLMRSKDLDLERTARVLLNKWDHQMGFMADEASTEALTKRELDVLRLVAEGLTNPQIAEKLVFTVGTVKWYLHQIYTKLDVGNRTQAVIRARELGLLS